MSVIYLVDVSESFGASLFRLSWI